MSPLVHAYNATEHESTGFAPFYLMFGRHSQLAIDAFLGLETKCDTGKNKMKFVHNQQARFAFTYRKAAVMARHKGENYKRYYDAAVRENKLEIGDRVLVLAVCFQQKHKITDRCEEKPYRVIRRPIPGIQVFDVQREDGTGRIWALQRNQLLPITSLPIDEHHDVLKQTEEQKAGRQLIF